MRILTEPRNALVKQFRKLFEMDGVELEITDDALRAIAREALARKTGARGLRAILEEVMLEIMYDIPSRRDVKKCVITKETIVDKEPPRLVLVDHRKVKKEEPA